MHIGLVNELDKLPVTYGVWVQGFVYIQLQGEGLAQGKRTHPRVREACTLVSGYVCVCGATEQYKKGIAPLRLALHATSSVSTLPIERTLVLLLLYFSYPCEPCGTHTFIL